MLLVLSLMVFLANAPEGLESASQDTRRPISERGVFFMEATPERIEEHRRELGKDDFFVMTDHLMWYRSEASRSTALPWRT